MEAILRAWEDARKTPPVRFYGDPRHTSSDVFLKLQLALSSLPSFTKARLYGIKRSFIQQQRHQRLLIGIIIAAIQKFFCLRILIVHQNYTKTLPEFVKIHSSIPFWKGAEFNAASCHSSCVEPPQRQHPEPRSDWQGNKRKGDENEKLCNSMKSESIYYHREKRVKHVTSHSLDAFRNKVTLLTWYKWNNYYTVRCATEWKFDALENH